MEQTKQFLLALWEGMPEDKAIQLWQRGDKRTRYFRNIEAAASVVSTTKGEDIYVAAGLGPYHPKQTKKRASSKEIVAIPGVWADIDVNGGPESKTGVAPTIDKAVGLAESIMAPTILVNSGYGLQAWWLFEGGPWVFDSSDEQAEAERLVQGFQAALRSRARDMGFSLDSTHDLARLMRIPGGQNCKGIERGLEPAAVTLVSDDGPRYERKDLMAVAMSPQALAMAARAARTTGEGVDIEVKPEAQPNWEKHRLLQSMNDGFADAWAHKPRSRAQKEWSLSEWDLSLANYAAHAGWTDQEISDLLSHHRTIHGSDKGNRPDYIARTIARARDKAHKEDLRRHAEAERDDAVEDLVNIAAGIEEADAPITVSLFSKVVGGPQVKELIQDSRDPDMARFRLALADGREIPIGPINNLTNQGRFRERLAVATQHLAPAVKQQKWDEVVRALLATARVNESVDDDRSHHALDWVESYIDRRLSTDKNAACQAKDPWTDDHGVVYVALSQLHSYVRKIRGVSIDEPDLKQYLEAAGFDRKTINYVKDTGQKSTRSYYCIDGASIGQGG